MEHSGFFTEQHMIKPVVGVTCHAYPSEIRRVAAVQIYIDAIVSAGAAPILIPLHLDDASLRRIFSLLDGLLLPGGDDIAPDRYGEEPHPKLGAVDADRDALELTLARWAIEGNLPTLGICRGAQVLAVAAGGSLYQDLASQHESEQSHDLRHLGREHLCHTIQVSAGSRLHNALGTTTSRVNSLHHQAVRQVPSGFAVSAVSEDGIIEAIEGESHDFLVGIQCHPEGIWNCTAPEYRGLFDAFIASARQAAATRESR
ncbi:MAG TPA: gamma-glutamyl-gamma-aminobutyrate hydrolase family protein [Chloroflexota bacterium]|nr:gamma-glutamyl-gamma-aminobutyrate hydrolase family protein [Chloroflexota bacterium]